MSHTQGRWEVPRSPRPVSASSAPALRPLTAAGGTCPASSPAARPSFVWWLGGAAANGDRWGGSRHPQTSVPAPLPPCAPCSPPGAGCSAPGSRRLVGRGPGAPNSPREARRRAAGEGRARLPLPRCVTGGGTARCGRRCAAGGGGARGAAIFGDLGAAGAPPAAREAAARAAPSPPAAGPESPAGRGWK